MSESKEVSRRERRRFGRSRSLGLDSHFGEVVDFSEGGIRIIRRGRDTMHTLVIGTPLPLQLVYNGTHHEVMTEIIRVERLGIGRHEIALRLIEPGAKVKLWLLAIAADSESVGSGPQAFSSAA